MNIYVYMCHLIYNYCRLIAISYISFLITVMFCESKNSSHHYTTVACLAKAKISLMNESKKSQSQGLISRHEGKF